MNVTKPIRSAQALHLNCLGRAARDPAALRREFDAMVLYMKGSTALHHGEYVRRVTAAASGSTTPEATPPAKARGRDPPSARRGRETMAPSGKFWMAMPSERASAPAAEISAPPVSIPA